MTTAAEIVITNRMDPLLFGYFAWADSSERQIVREAGTGIFVAPRLALSARHVLKSFEKLDPQFDALNRRKTPLDPQYQIKPVVSEVGSILYQIPQFNPDRIDDCQLRWKPLTAFGSLDTDIVSLVTEPRTRSAAELEATQRFFEWHLLPPPVGSLVQVFGMPDQRIEVEPDSQEVEAEVWSWNARVERQYPFVAHGFADFPVYELHREFPGGVSGAPVLYDGLLAGIFIGPKLVACLWPLALHTYWDELHRERSFAAHFDSGAIAAWDWHEVKGRVHRAPCVDVVRDSHQLPCSKTHVTLR